MSDLTVKKRKKSTDFVRMERLAALSKEGCWSAHARGVGRPERALDFEPNFKLKVTFPKLVFLYLTLSENYFDSLSSQKSFKVEKTQ